VTYPEHYSFSQSWKEALLSLSLPIIVCAVRVAEQSAFRELPPTVLGQEGMGAAISELIYLS
jgi:hypothetical protein